MNAVAPGDRIAAPSSEQHGRAAARVRRKCACGATAPALAGSCDECVRKKCLTHRTAEKIAHDKDVSTGDALTGIKASKKGPISLSGDADKPGFEPFEVPAFTDKGRGSGGLTGRLPTHPEGFAYRWRLFDADKRHYLLRAYGGDALDWVDFTDQKYAVVGRKTRDLMAKRGVTAGRIECTVKIPGKGEKTVALDLEFEP